MEQIAKTQDPKEQQRMLAQHWSAMQETMGEMHAAWGGHGMGGHGMGGPMMGGHMMWKDYRELTPEQLRQRHT
jgi:hypothetical protein